MYMSHYCRPAALGSGIQRFHERKLDRKYRSRGDLGVDSIYRQMFFIHGLMARYLTIDIDSGAQMS